MVDERGESHPHLADDLGPPVQRVARVGPLREGEARPGCVRGHGTIIARPMPGNTVKVDHTTLPCRFDPLPNPRRHKRAQLALRYQEAWAGE
jgi:hypothetical protein